jgi:glycosyltransferase involved in cell wall biosynthesis
MTLLNKQSILFISEADSGGAGLACMRLSQSLNCYSNSYRSQVLVRCNPISSDSTYEIKAENTFDRLYTKLQLRISRKISSFASKLYHSQATVAWPRTGLPRYIHDNFSKASVVHLHSIGSSMMSLSELSFIKKPLVWTLHDEWPTHGFLHYSHIPLCPKLENGYDRNQEYVENAPFHPSFKFKPVILRELESIIRSKLESRLRCVDLFISPSQWLADKVRSNISSFNPKIAVLPNPIDCSFWMPVNKAKARAELGMRHDVIYILYVGTHLSDPRKGHDLLKRASFLLRSADKKLVSSSHIRLAVIGPPCPVDASEYGLEIDQLNTATDEASMRRAYSACDILCIPSLADNLPNVGTEAQACGLPVVCFDTGGLPEIVDDGVTGFICDTNWQNLAHALIRLATNPSLVHEMSAASRKGAIQKWDDKQIATNYENLLNGLTQSSK